MLSFVPIGFPPLRTRRSSSIPAFGASDWLTPDSLRAGLRGQGCETNEPVVEDWGWVLPVINEPFPLWIGCGHYQEYPDGFLFFIEPRKSFVRKLFKKIDTRERIAALQRAMDKVLAEDARIWAKCWWTHEEFNTPSLGDLYLGTAGFIVGE